MNKVINKAFACATIVALGAMSTAAMATAHIDVLASSILPKNDVGGVVTLYYTGSVCSSGHLSMDSSDTPDRVKTLWATVMSAKAAGQSLGFDYDFNGDTCIIRAFTIVPG
ncbi:hypothetical protein C8J98_104219 [Luteibacter sp. OK325]|uniref:hypothetical protein n=1 Tax=Luteibacter sp. OK325 TaxID=2135670 RepID=UPI000D360C92|nr:hypothetical protein [Luteibacter sp. OK325]PTR33008.1 hypothetical protein C8J98_104219 [Luteibacter sp. OK325]